MKNRLLAAMIVTLLPLSAHAAEPAPEPCKGMPCTPRLTEIGERFQTASAISEADLPLIGSGECYHLSDHYSASHTHFGAVFLDPKDGKVYMGGSFGFFFPENPYKDWTPEKVRRENSNLYAENHLVELTKDFAFSDMNPGQTPIWWYWIKKSGTKIYVMGHWGVFHRFLCELDQHG